MKAEREIIAEIQKDANGNSDQPEFVYPEPQTELGAKLIALAKEIDKSSLPKLSIEEIEKHLGRKLGGIAAIKEALHYRHPTLHIESISIR